MNNAVESGAGFDDLDARARSAYECYNGLLEHSWGFYLLNARAYALRVLERYDEGMKVTQEYFSRFASDADSTSLANFFMYGLAFRLFLGDFAGALDSYESGLPYASKLGDELHKRYLLNGGVVYAADGKFKKSLNSYRDVRQTFSSIPSPSSNGFFELYGRSVLGENEALLDLIVYADSQGVDLDQVISDLSDATSIFNLTRSHARHAVAYYALALAHTLDGNKRDSQIALDHALSIIDRHNLHRERIDLLYHRALIHFLNQEYPKTLADIDEALSLAKRHTIAEFDTRLHLLQGQAHEEAGQPAQAHTAYEAAFNVGNGSAMGRDRDLSSLAAASAFRVQAEIPPPDSAFPYLTYLFGFLGFLIVALIVALLAYFVWMALHRRKTQRPEPPTMPTTDTAPLPADAEASDGPPTPTTQHAERPPSVNQETPPPKQPAEAPTQPIPTEQPPSEPPTDEERPLDAEEEDAALFNRRLDYIERVIKTPDEVASIIQDPILANRLRTHQIKRNAHIFACAAALEEVEEGKTFENRPSNTYATYLKPRFTKKGWDWPLGVVEWTAFFEGRG